MIHVMTALVPVPGSPCTSPRIASACFFFLRVDGHDFFFFLGWVGCFQILFHLAIDVSQFQALSFALDLVYLFRAVFF